MSTVSQKYAQREGKPLIICDYSPPRGADLSTMEQVRQVGADFVCVAYSPGKSVRVDSVVMAHLISQAGGTAFGCLLGLPGHGGPYGVRQMLEPYLWVGDDAHVGGLALSNLFRRGI